MGYKDPEKQREYQRLWMKRRRDEWINSKGGSCTLCGSTDRLEIDHIDPTLKTVNPTFLWSLAEVRRLTELENCQVLCYAHHLEKTKANIVRAKHGTNSRYRTCRCRDCKEAHNAYNRSYRSRLKVL